MRAVVQRVSRATVTVDGDCVSRIGVGFLVLVGVGIDDTSEQARKLAVKISKMRVFTDSDDKMNLALKDVGGSALCVSQFTLLADTKKGNRPSFINAAKGEAADKLYTEFCDCLENEGIVVGRGIFGADMKVELLNDGPVTIVMDV